MNSLFEVSLNNKYRVSAHNQPIYADNTLQIERHIINKTTKLHHHDCFELEFVLSGNAVNSMNEIETSVSARSFYILCQADLHKVVPQNSVDILSIKFTEPALSKS